MDSKKRLVNAARGLRRDPLPASLPSMLRRWTLPASAALLCLCAGLWVACGAPNQDACLAYVDYYNACHLDDQVDPPTSCPASLDSTSADCTGYYACLQTSTDCDVANRRLTGDTTACSGCI